MTEIITISEELENKLSRARFNLYLDFPFFAGIAHYFTFVAKPGPLAAVDAQGRMYVDPERMVKLKESTIKFIIAHEVMHVVQSAFSRVPIGVIFPIWNIAADIVINRMIHEDGGIPLPTEVDCKPLYGPEYAKYKDMTTEEVYADLMKNVKVLTGQELQDFLDQMGDKSDSDGVTSGKLKGKWFDDSASKLGGDREKDSGDKEGQEGQNPLNGMTDEERAKWQQRAVNANESAKMAGKQSGALDQFITQLLQPKRDWRSELRWISRQVIRRRYSWKRPNRRTISTGMRTPGRDGDTPTAVCYIDTSGSQSDEDITRCLSETKAIFDECGGEGHLILGDAVIYYSGVIDSSQLSRLKEVHRGGTDFTVIFDHIAEWDKEPSILVGFTDLCGPFPKSAPNYPVVWCVPKSQNGYSGQAPWGRVIEVEVK